MQISDNIFLGPVSLPAQREEGPSSPQNGIGPAGRVYIWNVLPATLGAALLGALQAATGGVFLMAAGAGVTTRVSLVTNAVELVLDTPRNVSVTASGANTATATVTGFDQYGQRMTETFAAPTTSTVQGNKAFKVISSIVWSATPGSTVSAGIGDKFGLPIAVADPAYIISNKWGGVIGIDGGTFVPAVGTTATPSTGDVRGTYTPSSASNGTRRLVVALALDGSQVGPNATRLAAAGVTQA